jgi:hypothetical protein
MKMQGPLWLPLLVGLAALATIAAAGHGPSHPTTCNVALSRDAVVLGADGASTLTVRGCLHQAVSQVTVDVDFGPCTVHPAALTLTSAGPGSVQEVTVSNNRPWVMPRPTLGSSDPVAPLCRVVVAVSASAPAVQRATPGSNGDSSVMWAGSPLALTVFAVDPHSSNSSADSTAPMAASTASKWARSLQSASGGGGASTSSPATCGLLAGGPPPTVLSGRLFRGQPLPLAGSAVTSGTPQLTAVADWDGDGDPDVLAVLCDAQV